MLKFKILDWGKTNWRIKEGMKKETRGNEGGG
jgi:hypothetical protein